MVALRAVRAGRAVVGSAIACALFAASCAGNTASDFPPGLSPLDDTNQAVPPAAKPGDPYPEDVSTATGETDDYSWAQAKGYVHAPIEVTFAAMHAKDVCVDRRKVDEWTITEGVEPEYLFSELVHNVVHSIVTVEFDMTWRFDVIEGTHDLPTTVAGRFMKTYGTTYINLLAGSIVAHKVDDQTTEIELIEHLAGHGQGPGTAESLLRDYFWSVVAVAHGQPLPTY